MTSLTLRLAAQNVGRRPVRSLLLGTAVALAVAVGFASYVVGWSAHGAMADSDARAGADLVIVPRDTLVNLTSSLLTVQPTDATLDAGTVARIGAIEGVARASRQRLVHVDVDGGTVALIAFDPATDFTVQPWLRERKGDSVPIDAVVAGGRSAGAPGDAVRVCRQPLTVHAKLRPSGVGPFDDAYFVSFAGLDRLAAMCAADRPRGHPNGPVCAFDRLDEASAVLVRLAPGAPSGTVTLALAQIPGVKVVEGSAAVRGQRDALPVLLAGLAAVAAAAGAVLVVLVALLFSAIVNERRREIGILRALGARPRQVIAIVLTEASLVTGAGGAFGVVLGGAILSMFARTVGFGLAALGVPLAWPPVATVLLAALVAVTASVALGVAGAWVPAWWSQRHEPYAQVSGAS